MLYLIHFANGSRGPLQERFNGIIDHSDLGLFDIYQFRRQKDGPSSFAPLLVWTTVKILWSTRTFCIRQFGPFPFVSCGQILRLIRMFCIIRFGPFP